MLCPFPMGASGFISQMKWFTLSFYSWSAYRKIQPKPIYLCVLHGCVCVVYRERKYTKILTILCAVEVIFTLFCVIWFIFEESVLFVEGRFVDQKGRALGLLDTLSPRLRKGTLQMQRRGCLQFTDCLLPVGLPILFLNSADTGRDESLSGPAVRNGSKQKWRKLDGFFIKGRETSTSLLSYDIPTRNKNGLLIFFLARNPFYHLDNCFSWWLLKRNNSFKITEVY